MFHINQRVVCIQNFGDDPHPLIHLVPNLPRKGGIYHVREFTPEYRPGPWILLREIVNPPVYGLEPNWAAHCFRPVIERKTDISIFEAMLNPSDRKVAERVE